MATGYEIKGRPGPTFKIYSPQIEIPALPDVEAVTVVSTLQHEDTNNRTVSDCHISNLREVVAAVIDSPSRLADLHEITFSNVVVDHADLTDLKMPFELVFLDCFFLDGLHLNGSELPRVSVNRGYIHDSFSLNDLKGYPLVQLSWLHVGRVWASNSELDCFDCDNVTLGDLVFADSHVKRHVTLHEVSLLMTLELQGLTVERIDCHRCTFGPDAIWLRFRDVNCNGSLQFYECKIMGRVVTIGSSCSLLTFEGSIGNGHLDFRGLTFSQLNVTRTMLSGPFIISLDQLTDLESSRGRWSIPWDEPARLQSNGKSPEAKLKVEIEQLAMLRAKFKDQGSTQDEADFCAYKLMDAYFRLRRKSTLTNVVWFFSKWAAGFLIVWRRILMLNAVVILLFSVIYLGSSGWDRGARGELLTSEGTQLYNDGILNAIGSSLYFSVVTFSTLGYGDIHPVGWLRYIAMFEALFGLILMALFTIACARRVLRW